MKAFPSERSQKEEVDVFRRGCRRLYGPSENACCAFPYLAGNFDQDRNIFKCTLDHIMDHRSHFNYDKFFRYNIS